jgi:hypothetical protein
MNADLRGLKKKLKRECAAGVSNSLFSSVFIRGVDSVCGNGKGRRIQRGQIPARNFDRAE